MFTERSWVQYATVFLSGWSLAILAIKWAKLRLQARALSLRLVPDAGDFVLSPVTAPLLLHNIYAAVDDPRHFLLLNRIARSLGSLKNMGRVSDVDDVLRSQAENDENYLESTHTLVHGFVWAIPVLGFIGTVLGLSDAIGSFGSILTKGAEMSDLRAGLQSVTSGLSVAFETTLVALVAALCIQLLLTLLKKREMEFLDACGDYCHANIVSKVRIVNLESTPAGEGRTP
ncbi:MAG: MotA/TolQ/ExbB proton channel family protein [Planctomycetes bacterium]|nr:MotA/TolQ/ExbB proton channel family protein [Planctomycetota bacterium]